MTSFTRVLGTSFSLCLLVISCSHNSITDSVISFASLARVLQLPTVFAATVAPDVTTYHYNLARNGLNPYETILTPANVNSTDFGKIGSHGTDGHVDAEPLFLANLTVAGKLHNVLYVATEHGSVYALDADTLAQLWRVSVIPAGETTSDDHGCPQISPAIGITSTPVIDRRHGPHGTIFIVAMSKDVNNEYHQRLHALDVTTGVEMAGSPTEVTASYPGTGDNSQDGRVVFNPSQYAERAALTLYNGNIYTAWTSHCDAFEYTAWVIAYNETTLKQTQILNLTPNGRKGSVWMSGGGIAVSDGYLYLPLSNGTFDTTLDNNGFPSHGDYGNGIVKLNPLSVPGGRLTVADYFNTYNTVSESDLDLDLGSGGVITLPPMTDVNGASRNLIVAAGKDQNIFLADRTNLGKFNPSTVAPDHNVYQKITGQLAGRNYSTPAYFYGVLYYGASGDSLKAFPFSHAKLPASPSSHSATIFGYPGTTPAVSANGSRNGIVWAVEGTFNSTAILHAYNPADLSHEYYNSTQGPGNRDAVGASNKFITPLVVNGKVYIGTPTGVTVFGLLHH